MALFQRRIFNETTSNTKNVFNDSPEIPMVMLYFDVLQRMR